MFPHPLNLWFQLSMETVSSHTSLNGSLQLRESATKARLKQLHTVPAAPILPRNFTVSRLEQLHIYCSYCSYSFREFLATIFRGKNSLAKKGRKRIKVYNDAKVVPPLPQRIAPPCQLQKYIWSLSPNDALLYAKKEIEHASVVKDEPYLYAPLFLNVTVFKRYRPQDSYYQQNEVVKAGSSL